MKDFNSHLPFSPTKEQVRVLQDIHAFIQKDDERKVMIVKGAAGTGKTSIMNAVKNIALEESVNYKLSSPTGRAAKVLQSKTNADVKTIHSQIFIPEVLENGRIKFNLRKVNDDGRTLYIVDEASMISNSKNEDGLMYSDDPLLTSFFNFVNMGEEGSKILFVGDPFQLPPIVSMYEKSFSPALDEIYLRDKFGVKVGVNILTEVKRQTDESPVLDLATSIRYQIENGDNMYSEYPQRYGNWWDVKDAYMKRFSEENKDNVVVICHTNKDVNWWNNTIRNERFGYNKKILEVGDIVTVSRNTWTKQGMIFNGDSGIIRSVGNIEKEFGGLTFSEVVVEFDGYEKSHQIETLVCLEALLTKTGSLTQEQEKKLYSAVMQMNPVFRESGNLQDDKYLSALRLRYGYASTCHKAQGGEWETVYVHPYLDMLKRDRANWLYTAYTRAKSEVYSWKSN